MRSTGADGVRDGHRSAESKGRHNGQSVFCATLERTPRCAAMWRSELLITEQGAKKPSSSSVREYVSPSSFALPSLSLSFPLYVCVRLVVSVCAGMDERCAIVEGVSVWMDVYVYWTGTGYWDGDWAGRKGCGCGGEREYGKGPPAGVSNPPLSAPKRYGKKSPAKHLTGTRRSVHSPTAILLETYY
jgi:hypothetical protein